MITYDRDKFIRGEADDGEWSSENEENEENEEIKVKMGNRTQNEKKPLPVMFCVSEYNQQYVVSYHYVDTKSIPDNYNYEFKDYKLL
jgi:hypothetical protein